MHLNPIRMPELMEGQPLGADRYPLFNEVWGRNFGEGQAMLLADAILDDDPYPIRGMIVAASNPLVTWPNRRRLERALEKLEFLAVMDLFMTPTARRADLFLPAATFLERVELCDYYGTLQAVPYVAMRRKLFQAGEAVSDLDFWIELGKRMGYGEHFPWRDSTEALDYALEPSGFSIADVAGAADGGIPFGTVRLGQYAKKGGFATPSKKVELWSATLAELGHDGVPRHVDSPQGPLEARLSTRARGRAGRSAAGTPGDYPLLMTTGARTLHYLHSEYRDVERLARRARRPAGRGAPADGRRVRPDRRRADAHRDGAGIDRHADEGDRHHPARGGGRAARVGAGQRERPDRRRARRPRHRLPHPQVDVVPGGAGRRGVGGARRRRPCGSRRPSLPLPIGGRQSAAGGSSRTSMCYEGRCCGSGPRRQLGPLCVTDRRASRSLVVGAPRVPVSPRTRT